MPRNGSLDDSPAHHHDGNTSRLERGLKGNLRRTSFRRANKAPRAIFRGTNNRHSRVRNREITKSNARTATNPEETRKEDHLRFQGDGNYK